MTVEDSPVNGQEPESVWLVGHNPRVFEQQANASGSPAVGGGVERGVAIPVLQVDINVRMGQQDGCDGVLPVSASLSEGGALVFFRVSPVDVKGGIVPEDHLHRIDVTTSGCLPESTLHCSSHREGRERERRRRMYCTSLSLCTQFNWFWLSFRTFTMDNDRITEYFLKPEFAYETTEVTILKAILQNFAQIECARMSEVRFSVFSFFFFFFFAILSQFPLVFLRKMSGPSSRNSEMPD